MVLYYRITVVYAVRRWPKRRYAARTCTRLFRTQIERALERFSTTLPSSGHGVTSIRHFEDEITKPFRNAGHQATPKCRAPCHLEMSGTKPSRNVGHQAISKCRDNKPPRNVGHQAISKCQAQIAQRRGALSQNNTNLYCSVTTRENSVCLFKCSHIGPEALLGMTLNTVQPFRDVALRC